MQGSAVAPVSIQRVSTKEQRPPQDADYSNGRRPSLPMMDNNTSTSTGKRMLEVMNKGYKGLEIVVTVAGGSFMDVTNLAMEMVIAGAEAEMKADLIAKEREAKADAERMKALTAAIPDHQKEAAQNEFKSCMWKLVEAKYKYFETDRARKEGRPPKAFLEQDFMSYFNAGINNGNILRKVDEIKRDPEISAAVRAFCEYFEFCIYMNEKIHRHSNNVFAAKNQLDQLRICYPIPIGSKAGGVFQAHTPDGQIIHIQVPLTYKEAGNMRTQNFIEVEIELKKIDTEPAGFAGCGQDQRMLHHFLVTISEEWKCNGRSLNWLRGNDHDSVVK